MELNMS